MSVSAENQQTTGNATVKPRLIAVGSAVVGALVVWALAEFAFGVDLHSPAMGGQPPQQITAGWVVIVAAIVSLLGWGVLALLEKFTSNARTVWTVLAGIVFLVSLSGPWSGPGITTGNRLLLMLIHVVVAGLLIPQLSRTSAKKTA